MCSVETLGGGLGASASAASLANSAGPEPEEHLGQELGEARLERDPAREAAGGGGHPGGEHARHFLVRPVLQQPGEEQVPGLEQGEVLLVLHLADWAAGGPP